MPTKSSRIDRDHGGGGGNGGRMKNMSLVNIQEAVTTSNNKGSKMSHIDHPTVAETGEQQIIVSGLMTNSRK